MNETKRLYESTFIINASLEDTQIETLMTKTQEFITRNGGEIQAVNRWGRKRLTYSIKKKNNGFYVNIEFTAPGTLIEQLERGFQLDENMLRFLTVQVDKKSLKARKKRAAAEVLESPVATPEQVLPPKVPLFEDEDEPTDAIVS